MFQSSHQFRRRPRNHSGRKRPIPCDLILPGSPQLSSSLDAKGWPIRAGDGQSPEVSKETSPPGHIITIIIIEGGLPGKPAAGNSDMQIQPALPLIRAVRSEKVESLDSQTGCQDRPAMVENARCFYPLELWRAFYPGGFEWGACCTKPRGERRGFFLLLSEDSVQNLQRELTHG